TIANRRKCSSVILSDRGVVPCGWDGTLVGLASVDVAGLTWRLVSSRVAMLLIGLLLTVGRSQPLSQNPRQLPEKLLPPHRRKSRPQLFERHNGRKIRQSNRRVRGGRVLPC